MSVFTRTTRRIAKGAAVGALGLALALGSTACSAGKISQTNNKEAAINGANGTIALDADQAEGDQVILPGSIAIRNLQIMYPVEKSSEIFGDGGPFKLVFTIANDSQIRYVKLTGITAPQGKVEFITSAGRSSSPGDSGIIAPNSYLNAGVPSNLSDDEAENDGITRIDAELSNTGETVAAGLTVPLTLTFEVYDVPADKDGKPTGPSIGTKTITISTPVDGSNLEERNDVVRDVQPPHGEGGGH